jgi:peptidoglycan/xylan/chitin deacetylase (PgdA/CDA1 family)
VDASGSPISIDEAAFRRHAAFLASGSVRVVALEELLRLDARASAVAITFDDGFVNFGDVAWPLLREHAIPVTLFVVSAFAGATNDWGARPEAGIPSLPLLDWDRLARLAEDGVALGAHSRTHPDLRRLTDDALSAELAGSADDIAAHTGTRPALFAYPYGRLDTRVVAAVARAYSMACTTELRPLAAGDDPLRLPRLDAFYLRAPGRLEAWDTPAFALHMRLRSLARTVRERTRDWFGAA